MNRNKPKYVSVRQDSFVFEGANSRMIPSATASALRRLNSEDASRTGAALNMPDDVSAQIKINEVTLFAQNNEDDWNRSKRIYKAIELATYLIGLLITIVSFLYSVCLLLYSNRLRTIPSLFKLLDINMLIANSSLFYFIIEILLLVIYITDLLRIIRIWSCFKLEQRIKSKELVLKTSEYESEQQQDSKIAETIENLKIRCAIREKFLDVLNPLIKLNILITLYFLFFVFLPKYVISMLIQLNLPVHLKSAELALVDYVTSNSTTSANLDTIAKSLNCCYLLSYRNETILLNVATNSSNERACNTNLSESNCLVNLNNELSLYVHILVAIFYATATVTFFLKMISLFNFKYWLMHRLLFKTKVNEDTLCKDYDDSRSRLFRRHLESKIAENERFWAENFLDLNLYGDNKQPQQQQQQSEPDNNRYLNLEMENFLNEDERKAIEMIDNVLARPVETNTNTFKAKKNNKN